MFRRLVAAIAAMCKYFGQVMPKFFDWLEQVVRWPFSLVFGSGQPMPHFAPETTHNDVVEEFRQARKDAAVQTLDRDGVETVLEFCRAHPSDRATMRLPSNILPTVRAALLTMNDADLRKIATSGIGQVRRFLSGETLDPDAQVPVAATDKPPKGMSTHERTLWKIRARLLNGQLSDTFKIAAP